jgi:NitT/TauT family transport system substrate-binding protein
MSTHSAARRSRREFLHGLTMAGMATLLGLRARPAAPEPPPETTTLTLAKVPSICSAPLAVAEELFKAEGFREVQFVKKTTVAESYEALASAELHFNFQAIGGAIFLQLDAGVPVVVLAGVHTGCYELFATDQVRTVGELKGRTVSLGEWRSGRHAFLVTVLTHVGLTPHKDVNVVVQPPTQAMQLLADRQIDAFVGFPPEPQELRAKRIGHVLVNSTLDRPWSHYFCCMIVASQAFVRRHPIATKRALRAILKASNLCALEPERAARLVVDKGHSERYDYALQTLHELPYTTWREYDAEDSVRFYALRLHEAGLIKSTPQKIIAQHTDWRFLNELKRELKG